MNEILNFEVFWLSYVIMRKWEISLAHFTISPCSVKRQCNHRFVSVNADKWELLAIVETVRLQVRLLNKSFS